MSTNLELALEKHLRECGFEPGNHSQSSSWFQEYKQVNIQKGHTVSVFWKHDGEYLFVGKFTIAEVLIGENKLLEYFLEN